jgi:hypothetical protein
MEHTQKPPCLACSPHLLSPTSVSEDPTQLSHCCAKLRLLLSCRGSQDPCPPPPSSDLHPPCGRVSQPANPFPGGYSSTQVRV